MSIINITAEHQRIAILIALKDSADYGANLSMISDVLSRLGLGGSHDQIKTQLSWLEQNGYITIEKLTERTWIARITQSGLDVAEGHVFAPGIKRPGPRSKI